MTIHSGTAAYRGAWVIRKWYSKVGRNVPANERVLIARLDQPGLPEPPHITAVRSW